MSSFVFSPSIANLLVGQIEALYGGKAVKLWVRCKEGFGLEVIDHKTGEVLHKQYPPPNISARPATTLAMMRDELAAPDVVKKFKERATV